MSVVGLAKSPTLTMTTKDENDFKALISASPRMAVTVPESATWKNTWRTCFTGEKHLVEASKTGLELLGLHDHAAPAMHRRCLRGLGGVQEGGVQENGAQIMVRACARPRGGQGVL